ncbi:MAG TPA: HD-GYP domain-containing protein [Rhodocyclaceae bacterium]|jgi:putative nucleotidyltransferase with HDIG domain
MISENAIAVEQLQVGLYIHLDLSWLDHPFSLNSFKICTEDQIQTIRKLGLKTVRWNPARSDTAPRPITTLSDGTKNRDAVSEEVVTPIKTDPALISLKQDRIQRLAEHRQRIAQVEREFARAAKVVRSLNETLFALPEKALSDATELVRGMSQTLLAAPELAIHLMSEANSYEDAYSHPLNVAVLAMLLGKQVELPEELIKELGIGALFHDVGLSRVPSKIVKNNGLLKKSEREFFELHCQYGEEMAREAGFPKHTQTIIYQHHEHFDGTGYPQQLKGEEIDPLARIVALANAFDSLCNPVHQSNGLTPHEALAQMFSVYRSRFDPQLLNIFIHFMGIYPVGSLVCLSNGDWGMVISVRPSMPLRPTVVVYDPSVPKREAIVLDLAEDHEVNISEAVRPEKLPPAVYDYLSPKPRTSYYFDSGYQPGTPKL